MRENVKQKAKRRKPIGNKNKRVVRNRFESVPQKSIRIKSNKVKSASSTKVGRGNFISRITTIIRRIAKRG